MGEENKNISVEFLFSDENKLYLEFKKVIYEMLYAITLPCAVDEEIFYKMTDIINFKIFEKIKIKDLGLTLCKLPKEEVGKTVNALRSILERVGYYEEKSELSENLFLKNCQTIIDFLSAMQMCQYTREEETVLAVGKDSPFLNRLRELFRNYSETRNDVTEKIAYSLHAKFCETQRLSLEDSEFIESEVFNVAYPIIVNTLDGLNENLREILISSLDEIYDLMKCTQNNSKCEKRTIMIKLIKSIRASVAIGNFCMFLKKKNEKEDK